MLLTENVAFHPTSAEPGGGGGLAASGAAAQIYRDLQKFVLVSDLDGTLIDPLETDDPNLVELSRFLAAGERLTLWFNSSRPVPSQRESLEVVRHLPAPRFHIGAMGTQVANADGKIIDAYGHEQFGDWPRAAIDDLVQGRFGLVPHAPHLQTRYKASYDLPEPQMAPAIEGELQARGIPVKLVVSSGRDLDILPPAAGKAAAIRWLCGYANVPQESVLVSGDSANDLDMFADPFRGIVVGNGHEELKRQTQRPGVYHAKARCCGGVLEGLRHFGVIPT